MIKQLALPTIRASWVLDGVKKRGPYMEEKRAVYGTKCLNFLRQAFVWKRRLLIGLHRLTKSGQNVLKIADVYKMETESNSMV
jgi:hypothetical protein